MKELSDIILEDFYVEFITRKQKVKALRKTSLTIEKNKTTVIIGETGSGKSVLALGILDLLPNYAKIGGKILYNGNNLLQLKSKERRHYLGRIFGYIPQNPSESLNPIRKINKQMEESLRLIYNDKEEISKVSEELISSFGFKDPARVLESYPFQLSGGMQQRALTAISLASKPQWIIADEPTKGLDRKIQKEVLDVFRNIKKQGIDSMLIITHDINLAREFSDQIIVLYSGEIIEVGENILKNPLHPYTKGFINSLPENGMIAMRGKAPSPTEEIRGCRFSNRCDRVQEKCRIEKPNLIEHNGVKVRCFLYAEN